MMENKKEPDTFKKELDKLFAATTKSSMIHKCNMHVENGSGTFMWNKEYGERTIHSIMNLASVTKLFTTTCIINLIQQGKLSLTDHLDLELKNTYLMEKESDYCADMFYKNKSLHLPNVWLSIPASGGCMSTSMEVMVFLKAFFQGKLFDKSILKELSKFAMI